METIGKIVQFQCVKISRGKLTLFMLDEEGHLWESHYNVEDRKSWTKPERMGPKE